MKSLKIYWLCFLALLAFESFAQAPIQDSKPTFEVRGEVREHNTFRPIPRVNVEVNGGAYTTTDNDGRFRIQVRIGDELSIRHKSFETVYHTISSQDRIVIEVLPEETQYGRFTSRSDEKQLFKSSIDSAIAYLKTDAEKSMQFIAQALESSNSVKQNSEAYEVLSDVYLYLKQYDLAITNLRISLQNEETNDVKLKLALAYRLNKNYQESLETYDNIDESSLSNYQKVVLYEGIGDTHFETQEYTRAISSYRKGLGIAQNHLITPKVTDLNSKIAQAYGNSGQTVEAKNFYQNSLSLASQENKKRAVEEKVKVAEFESSNRNYQEEIELRKEALEDIDDIEQDSIIDIESALTPQKQNYKIGNAYFLQKDYDSAIKYLNKSIKEAEVKADLVVKKDAFRKLSDVYVDAGDYNKAKAAFQQYTETLDKLYIKKEQEISQAARFNRKISEKQNRITSLESERKLSESKYQLTQERSKRQELIIYSLIGGLVLLSVLAFVMYKYIKQQRLANNLLALKSLRSQMNPHFIFNALNSVNSFIASNDERAANKYLSEFSHLMRAVLENSEEDFIPLQKEIEQIELYTKLEHFRFQDKFDYRIEVDDDVDVNAYQIPPMLLQPYIENAVWHGLRYKHDKGLLRIRISKQDQSQISITITDDGIGRERSKSLKTKNQKKQNSKGMGNIKKRVAILNAMYKDKVDVHISDFQDEEDTGTKVMVTLKKD